MDVQQKLLLFSEKAMESVARQRRESAVEIQDAVRDALVSVEELGRREMKDKIKAEQHRLERESNKKIHAAGTEARKALSDLRERLSGELFADLERELQGVLNEDPAVFARFKEYSDDRIDIWHKWAGVDDS